MGMSDLDLVVRGGDVITPNGRQALNIAVRGGRIVALLDRREVPAADRVVDAEGLCVLPGAIDTHTHIRDPARPDREDFISGTGAAAAGGFTTIFEMPTSDPPVNTADRLTERAASLSDRALVDYCLYAGAGFENRKEIPRLADAGAIAFKTFMPAPAPGREPEFVGLWGGDRAQLYATMRSVAATGLVHCLHCEDDDALRDARAQLSSPSVIKDGKYHSASRPVVAEDAAISTVLEFAAALGAKIQIVHASSPSGVELAAWFRARGVDVTIETAPHYLFLDSEDLFRLGPFAKCNPPLREEGLVRALWTALSAGHIDMIGTDHCPYLETEVERGEDDIDRAPPGLPGLETAIPLLLTAVSEGRLTLQDVVRITAENAASRFGLPRKGSIGVGKDADLMLVDTASSWRFESDKAITRAHRNMRAYEGRQMTGRVIATFVRGVSVYDGNGVVADPGVGSWIRGPGVQVMGR